MYFSNSGGAGGEGGWGKLCHFVEEYGNNPYGQGQPQKVCRAYSSQQASRGSPGQDGKSGSSKIKNNFRLNLKVVE